MRKEQSNGAHIGRRPFVQEERGIRSKAIGSVLLGQESLDGQEIAEDSNPPLTGVCAMRDFFGSVRTVGNVGEDFQLYAGFNGKRHLVTIQGIKKTERSRL